MRRSRGFTLIEVLVALAVVAIGMAAVLEALTSSANATVYLRDKTFAQWVALNQVERVRLSTQSGQFPGTGTSTGHVRFANRSWHWRQSIAQTQVAGVERIVVDVRPRHATRHNWYATATGYIGNAIAPPNPLGMSWGQSVPGQLSGSSQGGSAGPQSGTGPSSTSTPSGPASPLANPDALP